MTDKEFDNILKEALTTSEVPSELNEKLINKIRKRKSSKLIAFAKPASAVAAVFICAVAILGYYDYKMPQPEENIPATPPIQSNFEEETAQPSSAGSNEKAEEENIQLFDSVQKSKAAQKKEVAAPHTASDLSQNVAAIESTEETDSGQALPEAFSKARVATPVLSELFNEDFDYKTVISEKISAQIALLENSSDYTFNGISGNEKITLNEENVLTIIFSAGEIVSEEHGEQFFTVGTVANGRLY